MDIKTLIKTAKNNAQKVKQAVPSATAEPGTELAVAADAKGKVYTGVTGITIKKGNVEKIKADYMAVLNMVNDGSRIASGVAVVKLGDLSVVKPSAECLELLFRTNVENDNCIAAVSETEGETVSSIRLGGSGADLMDGFDFGDYEAPEEPVEEAADDYIEMTNEEPKAAEPAAENVDAPEHSTNVISGVKIEENNPFYESPSDVKPPEEVIATVSGENLEAQALEREAEEEEPELSKAELLKQAKKRKKVAKANFLFRKRH
ncbi:MAG: hypothetical protein IJH80_09915 [Ruminococcus sp.]|nr:hypothetical protein [Ruminococcus sp.]